MNTVDYRDSPYSKIKLKENTRKDIVDKLYEKIGVGLTTPLGKAIMVEPKAIRNFLNGGFNKVHTIERLRTNSDIPMDVIRNSITHLDDIETPSLPFNFDSEEGARLDTGVFNEGRTRNRSVEYHNKDSDLIKIIIKCYKKLTGGKPRIKVGIDRRNDVYCIYFPPIFAKHYVKMGISEIPKIMLKTGIPEYIMSNTDFQRIWLRGTISEDGCIYPLVKDQGKYGKYLYPRIQINRTSLTEIGYNPLVNDECNILKNFGIETKPRQCISRTSSKGVMTTTYSITIYRMKDLEKWQNDIGFELKRHDKQFKILMDNFGENSRDVVREALVKFNKLIPRNLSGRHRFNILGD